MTAQLLNFAEFRAVRPASIPVEIQEPEPRQFSSRQVRRDNWWAAEHVCAYYDHVMQLLLLCERASKQGAWRVNELAAAIGTHHENWSLLVDLYRDAVAAQIRTPAPDQKAVNWKKSQLRQHNPYQHISAAEIAKAIAADEQYLAVNRRRKAGAA